MEAAAGNKWLEVWTRKGREAGDAGLEALMRADGFDAGTGSISVADWLLQAGRIAGLLGLDQAKNVLDVGCGAGAMLWPLRNFPLALFGVDYSETLLGIARQAIPGLTAEVAEAAALPFPEAAFEAIFCHAVFYYFPDLDYAKRVLEEFVRVLAPGRGRALILDVPDLALRQECERYRREVIYAGQEYPTGQDGPYRHTYYPRSFFSEFAGERGLRAQFTAQDLGSYPMSPYRYNVLIDFGLSSNTVGPEGAPHAATAR